MLITLTFLQEALQRTRLNPLPKMSTVQHFSLWLDAYNALRALFILGGGLRVSHISYSRYDLNGGETSTINNGRKEDSA